MLAAGARDLSSASFTVAASERGDALVAVGSIDAEGAREPSRVTRRLPGGAFGAPERLASRRTGDADSAGPPRRLQRLRRGDRHRGASRARRRTTARELWAAIAAARRAVRRAAADRPDRRRHAVRAHRRRRRPRARGRSTSGDRLVAAERSPGGGFGDPVTLARRRSTRWARADRGRCGPDGGARRRPGRARVDRGDDACARASRPGAFGPARRARRARSGSSRRIADRPAAVRRAPASPDRPRAGAPHAVLTADGRVLLTWGQLTRRQGIWRIVARAPRSRLLRRPSARRTRSAAPLRDVDAARSRPSCWPTGRAPSPGPTADPTRRAGASTSPARARRTPRSPPRPTVKVTRARLADAQARRAAARCASPATPRATCTPSSPGRRRSPTSSSLPAAGSRRARAAAARRPDRARAAAVRCASMLRSGAPGAAPGDRAHALAQAPARAARLPAARARRHRDAATANDLVVRWRTEKPASPSATTCGPSTTTSSRTAARPRRGSRRGRPSSPA